jgi:hypothetical protein
MYLVGGLLLANNAVSSLSFGEGWGEANSVSVLSSPLRGDKRGASYPNPANDVLFIDAKDYSYIDIKLYNIMGELVIEKTIDNASIGLDVSKLANGIYVYKALNNGLEIKVGKLVISK